MRETQKPLPSPARHYGHYSLSSTSVIHLKAPTKTLCPVSYRMKTNSSPAAPSGHVALDTSTSKAERGSAWHH